ncbi:MAG: DUF3990 domain-containing protein [Prevotella sp.]|nr:DUF3990 domain-containing protein [Prevotella sp.]
MILYHGTNEDFGDIDLNKSKPNKDFGQGFYLSREYTQAEEWAKFILLNRNNSSRQPAHDYDIVIGPIANDRVGVQLWKYENRSIDLPTLVHNLRNMRGITFQYFFGTERAVKILKRL